VKNYIIILALTAYSSHLFGQNPTSNETQNYYKKVIKHLASDELEGRLSGMEGEKKSAQFIKKEFIDAGLVGIENDSLYFQQFPYTFLRLPSPKNTFLLVTRSGPLPGTLNKSFFLYSQTCDTGLANTLAFDAGYGMVVEKKSYNDYKNYTPQDSGKVFLIKLGHPELDNPHSEFGLVDNIHSKIELALKYHASGIVFYNTDSITDLPTGKLDKTTKPLNIPIFYTNLSFNATEVMGVGMECYVSHVKYQATNVIAQKWKSSKKKYIIFGAHHDHLGFGEMGGSRSENQEIHNGADDNASGVAMMLHLAKTLPKHRAFKKYNMVFIAFSGEELGLLGSKYFVQNMGIDSSKVLCMFNFDMVGRLNPEHNTLVINGVGTSPYWKKRIKKIKTDTALLKITTTDGGIGASDHSSFYLANIPAVHFFSGQHREYHTPQDDDSLINYAGMERIENYTVKLACKYPKKKRNFTQTKNSATSFQKFKVTLGVMPDYTFTGGGMRIDNVSIGKTADKAGLQKNDVIIQMGLHSISNVESYMHALTHYNKGDTVNLLFLRNGVQQTVNILFE